MGLGRGWKKACGGRLTIEERVLYAQKLERDYISRTSIRNKVWQVELMIRKARNGKGDVK